MVKGINKETKTTKNEVNLIDEHFKNMILKMISFYPHKRGSLKNYLSEFNRYCGVSEYQSMDESEIMDQISEESIEDGLDMDTLTEKGSVELSNSIRKSVVDLMSESRRRNDVENDPHIIIENDNILNKSILDQDEIRLNPLEGEALDSEGSGIDVIGDSSSMHPSKKTRRNTPPNIRDLIDRNLINKNEIRNKIKNAVNKPQYNFNMGKKAAIIADPNIKIDSPTFSQKQAKKSKKKIFESSGNELEDLRRKYDTARFQQNSNVSMQIPDNRAAYQQYDNYKELPKKANLTKIKRQPEVNEYGISNIQKKQDVNSL